MNARLCGDDPLLDAGQDPLALGQGQAQAGQVSEVAGPGDPQDIGAVFFPLSPEAHQSHDPGHVVSTSTGKQPDDSLLSTSHPQLCDGPTMRIGTLFASVHSRLPLSTPATRAVALALVLATAGCSNVAKPGPQSVAGMSPDGTVIMTEIMAAGAEGGKGTLSFQGHSYPFKLVGGVTGGIGAADTRAIGEVYNLRSLSDFKGLYTQSSGGPGLAKSGASDLWLRNAAGVVLHLRGTQEGMTLSLGREEILIEML